MDQPTNIVTRPLSSDNPDDRIRMVLELTSDDPLPKTDEQAQGRFVDHLKTHLSFPFTAEYYPTTDFGPGKIGKVTILGFADPPLVRKAGIVLAGPNG